MTVQFIAPTKRKKISQKEAARLFLLHNGICCNCLTQIRNGEAWFIEHPDALVLGGADDDANRKPSHVKCKAAKDAADAAARSERDRHITKGWQRDGIRPPSRLRSAGFQKRPAQKTASRPLRRKSDRAELGDPS